MTEPIRWGIIGTGLIAHTFARDLAFTDDGVVAAVGSRSASSAEAFGDEFEVPRRYDSYEALVDDDGIDAVYVATPHPMHFANASLALEHGKPVLVEKAFTMTGQEARDLVALARSKKLFLMEAMWTRFFPHVVALREIVARGDLGELVNFEADHGNGLRSIPVSGSSRPNLAAAPCSISGSIPSPSPQCCWADLSGSAALDRARVHGRRRAGVHGLWLAGGAQSILAARRSRALPRRACVSGTRARVEIDGDFYAPTTFSVITKEGEREQFTFETSGRGLHYQAEEVARCLREGLLESDAMPLDESIAIMETIDAVLAFQLRHGITFVILMYCASRCCVAWSCDDTAEELGEGRPLSVEMPPHRVLARCGVMRVTRACGFPGSVLFYVLSRATFSCGRCKSQDVHVVITCLASLGATEGLGKK